MQIDEIIRGVRVDRSSSRWRTAVPKPPVATFETGRAVLADMGTSKGNMRIRLMPEVAPLHVTSFLYLAGLGFYDGLAFHRVIKGFMAQGGCPLGNGTGGPGYEFDGEFSPKARHDRPGLLSMANAGPGTDGSQFFLTFLPTPWLDGKHTLFGEIVEGMDTLRALEAAGSASGRSTETLTLQSLRGDLG